MNTELLNRWGEQFLKFAWPMLWQSSLLIAVIFVLDLGLRRKVRAAIRHALWLVVLAKLLLPPSFALPTGPSWWIHTDAPLPPPVKAPPVPFTVTYGEQMTMPDFPPVPAPVVPPKPPVLKLSAWTMIMSGVVSTGLFAWLLLRWRQVHRRVRRANSSGTAHSIMGEAQRLAQSHPGIRLKLTEDTMSPAVCGLFRPVVLLPRSLVEKLSVEQLRAVLLHELIHVRRGDVWVNCAQALLQIVYWWHPLLWLANARIRRVREEAVDDAVMLALRDDAEIYAPTLLEVAKFAFRRPLASLGLVGILESRSALRQRIERLMDFDAPKKAGLTVVSILGILAFSAVALPMGEAPEKTNGSDSSASNPKVGTNASPRVLGTMTNSVSGIMENTNFRAVLHALEQRTGVEKLAEPKAVSTAGRQVQLMSANSVLQQAQNVHTSSNRETIYRKLNSIRLESVNWGDGIALSEALRFLNEQSRLLDPDGKGINFIFNPGVGQPNNTASVRPQINPNTGLVETVPTNATPAAVDPKTITVKLQMADSTFHDVLDAVMMIADHPIKYSVEDYGVVISQKTPPSSQLETRVFKVDTNAFIMGLRNISVPVEKLPLPKLSDVQTNNFPSIVKIFFSLVGVDLTTPGRAVAFNDGRGLLSVRATPSEMDTVERVIGTLNMAPPQIHIKARFIEVEQDNNGPRGFDWYLGNFSNSPVVTNGRGALPPTPARTRISNTTVNAVTVPAGDQPLTQGLRNTAPTNANLTGILTDPNFRVVLHALEGRPKTTILAEPEAVTISGRQTQMHATDIITVLTNMNPLALKPPGVSSTNLFLTGQVECGPVFDVVPYVLSDGYTLNLTITASVTEFLGYDKSTNSITVYVDGKKQTVPVPLPQLRTQKISTVVNLWDNQTLVLSGPDTVVVQTTKEKVPVLGDVPLLGGLFRSQTQNSVKKKLMVFVTATIVDPAGNRVHSDDQLPFNPSTIPPQPH